MGNSTGNRPDNVIRGVALILAAALTISFQDVVFKIFSSQLSLWQIFALRGVLAIPMLLVLLWARGQHKGILSLAFGRWPLLRAVFITTTFLAFYAAIPFLSLSTVGAANYIAPIFVAMLSAFAIKEPVGPLGWLGVVIGFVGVVVLLRPGSDAFSLWSLLPVVGAVFYALAHITTRVKCQNIPLSAIALAQNLVMMGAGFLMSAAIFWLAPKGGLFDAYPYIFGPWSEISPSDAITLVLLAGFAVLISILLAGAYRSAPPAIISTFEYSYLVFVAIWDIAIFGIAPSLSSVTGMILIVLAGLLVLRCERPTASTPA